MTEDVLPNQFTPPAPAVPRILATPLYRRMRKSIADCAQEVSLDTTQSSDAERSAGSTPNPPGKELVTLRLIPTTLEEADAVILEPPLNVESIPNSSPPSSAQTSESQSGSGHRAFLLLGPALTHIRPPDRTFAKGARIHPYRILRREAGRKCSSSSSNPSMPTDPVIVSNQPSVS